MTLKTRSLTLPGMNVLKERREAEGMSQADLARAAGVGLTTIWRIERGEPAYWVTIEKLAAAFRVHKRELAILRKGGTDGADDAPPD